MELTIAISEGAQGLRSGIAEDGGAGALPVAAGGAGGKVSGPLLPQPVCAPIATNATKAAT